MQFQKSKAFTLVELIVVITILAILWTIAFISLQWYSEDTRNSVRISDISNIDKMLWLSIVTTWKTPFPDNKIDITASWILIWYQWNAWSKLLNTLWISNWWKDPLDERYYTYSVNKALSKYQILWFLEWDLLSNDSIINSTYAEWDLSKRPIIVRWDEVWILLDSVTNIPVQWLWVWVDISTTTNTYKTTFSEEIIVQWTWTTLFSNYYNRNKELLSNKELAILDDSLVLYMDMETTTMSWSTTVLKDLSQYWNNWECFNWLTIVDCWSNVWPKFINWYNDKSMFFDWIDDFISIPDSISLSPKKEITVIILFKSDTIQQSKWILTKWPYTSNYDYMFYITWLNVNSSSIQFYNKDSLNNHLIYSLDVDYSDNEFHFLASSLSAIDKKSSLYIDNTVSISNTNNSDEIRNTINNNLLLMRWWSWFAKWEIDEVRIYNRSLSDKEIKTLYDVNK